MDSIVESRREGLNDTPLPERPPPLKMEPGVYLDGIISVVRSLEEVWIQPVAYGRYIEDVCEKMSLVYNDLDREDLALPFTFFAHSGPFTCQLRIPGGLCAAKFKDDGQWYRARIIRRLTAPNVEVEFVDYGNRGEVAMSSVKKLLRKWVGLPPLAIQCRAGAESGEGNRLRKKMEGTHVIVAFMEHEAEAHNVEDAPKRVKLTWVKEDGGEISRRPDGRLLAGPL